MKKLIMVLVLGVIMVSCSNTPTEVKNPKQKTTVELQQLASIDSLAYKVIEKDDTVYILSIKDNTVVKMVHNQSGGARTLSLILVILISTVWAIILLKD
jgi:PBP1b-binding outer membrane lipoprotein LpoB